MTDLRLASTPVIDQPSANPGDASQPAATGIHDKIAEAYYGNLGEKFMKETRERIHWVCTQVKGTRVLDIGCSQGITSILLGREGKSVVGVDNDLHVIAQACQYLEREATSVQERVSFRDADVFACDFGAESFDTVIIAEVLEHLVQPERLVNFVVELLSPGERLIITVPFGINNFIDHKHTFYVLGPYELICQHFNILDTVVLGKWIGIVAERRDIASEREIEINRALLRKLEDGFLGLERSLRVEIDMTHQQLKNANLKYRDATEQVATLKKRLAQEESARKADESSIANVQAQLRESEQRLALLTEQLQQAKSAQAMLAASIDDSVVLQRKLDEAAEKYSSALEQTMELTEKLQALNGEQFAREITLSQLRTEARVSEVRLHHAYEQIEELKNRVVGSESARSAGEAELKDLVVRLALAEQSAAQALSLKAEIDQRLEQAQRIHSDETDDLRKDLNSYQHAFYQAEKTVVRLEAEISGYRSRLDESDVKNHAAAEQVSVLSEKIAFAQAVQESYSRDLERLRQALADKEQASADERRVHEQSLADKELQLAERNKAFQEKNFELSALETEVHALKADLKVADAERLSSVYEAGILRERIAALEAELKKSSLNKSLIEKDLTALIREFAGLKDKSDHEQKEISSARSEIIKLSSELETQKAVWHKKQHEFDQVKLESIRNRVELTGAHAQIEQWHQKFEAAQQQIVKIRSTLSFQLGHTLLFGFKSWQGFKTLPGRLWEIRKETLRRRAKPEIAGKTVAGEPLDLAIVVSAPCLPASSGPAPLKSVPELWAGTVAPVPGAFAGMLKAMKVAAIMDEFTFSSYRHECNLLQLTPQHWQKELEAFQPELLFIESAWRGKDELWGSKVGHMSQELVDILHWCRERGIPSAFWNKEDPIHFETFLNTAKLFDHVFTTDMDCIHRYKAALGHDRVYFLPFACQPSTNNPIEIYDRKDAFCFAGAYYVRYPERTRDLGNFAVSLPEFRDIEIYDRNFGKNDPNYQFPSEYKPFIVGNLPFDQIDRAYKGYRYAINLNSIKQSQTMFARRVYELLASNTITVSNYSRGVRLMFGDLVITSDSGMEIVRRLRLLGSDETVMRKLRLAALRKVMSEHTYQDRLAYVVSRVRNEMPQCLTPHFMVLAYVKNEMQVQSVVKNFISQKYKSKSLVLVVPGDFRPQGLPENSEVCLISIQQAQNMSASELGRPDDWLAMMVPDDHYGSNYLLDLALATRYAKTPVIGKAAHHVWSANSGLVLAYPGQQYRRVHAVPARSGASRLDNLHAANLREWVSKLYTAQLEHPQALSIDEFNYCKNAAAEGFADEQRKTVEDLAGLDTGVPLSEVLARAEQIAPGQDLSSGLPQLSGRDLASLFGKAPAGNVSLSVNEKSLQIDSGIKDGKHEYLYATQDHTPEALCAAGGRLRFHLEVTPGLNVQFVMLFLDAKRQRISHVVKTANRNHKVELPAGTVYVRLGLRIYAAGSACVQALFLGHISLEPAEILGNSRQLLLTNHYPSYADLYRNGFVHRRVSAYLEHGTAVDVFRLKEGEPVSYHEFENVDCITGSQKALHKILASGRYESVLVHFLDNVMWEVLRNYIDKVKVLVWVHGAEIQPLHRREFNYKTKEERAAARVKSDKRMAFWRKLLSPVPANLKLIFVSRYLAEEVMEDLGFRLPESAYTIIHNPIDTELFSYEPKKAEQRLRVLSIRPYASPIYANDLSVKAILELSKKPFFKKFGFRIIGDGPLFDETLAPLRGFENVKIEKRFLAQPEIAQLHKYYGVFLCPSRSDTQGVSRDEAMSSGLVPVTNAVAAIPEFVDESCGILAQQEDARSIADGIAALYADPNKFLKMSEYASQRVRNQSSSSKLVPAELLLFT